MKALARNTVKIASIMFIVVLAVSMFTSVVYADSLETDHHRVVLEKFIERLEASIVRINGIVSNRGIELPEDIRGNLTFAEQLLQMARDELNAGNYSQSRIYIHQAMKDLRFAAVYVCKAVEQEIREMFRESAARGLEVAIGMHRKFLDRLNGIVAYLEGEEIEISDEVKTSINNAYEILADAEAKLEEGEINETAKLLGESKREIAGLIGELHKVIRKEVGEGRITKEVGKHLKKMEDVAKGAEEKIKEIAKHKKETALKIIDKIIEKLENVKHNLENLKSYFESKGNVKAVKNINAAIQKVMERINQLYELKESLSK